MVTAPLGLIVLSKKDNCVQAGSNIHFIPRHKTVLVFKLFNSLEAEDVQITCNETFSEEKKVIIVATLPFKDIISDVISLQQCSLRTISTVPNLVLRRETLYPSWFVFFFSSLIFTAGWVHWGVTVFPTVLKFVLLL